MSYDDFNNEGTQLSDEDIKKHFTTPVYSDEEMEKKFRDWEPMTNYRAEIIKEEHRFSDKAKTAFVKITSKFIVKDNKTKIISDVFMMYPPEHQNFKRSYGKQEEFLRAIGVKREADTFVRLGFIGKTYDATLKENKDPAWANNPDIQYIDAGVIEEMKKAQESFNDDITF